VLILYSYDGGDGIGQVEGTSQYLARRPTLKMVEKPEEWVIDRISRT